MAGRYSFFGNTTQKLTPGRKKEVRGRQADWEDDAKVVWSDVTGLCGFWDGSFHTIMGWATIYKKCGPVPGKNSIDAEIAACSMLIESLKKRLDTCVHAH